jgi:hypothetical protein
MANFSRGVGDQGLVGFVSGGKADEHPRSREQITSTYVAASRWLMFVDMEDTPRAGLKTTRRSGAKFPTYGCVAEPSRATFPDFLTP